MSDPENDPSAGASGTGPMLAFDKYQRWRLVLGRRVESGTSRARSEGGAGAAGAKTLSPDMEELDETLGAIYDGDGDGDGDGESGDGGGSGGKRSAGLGRGKGRVAKWLGDLRKYFDKDVVVMVQQDAIREKNLRELLFEPEALEQVTPSVEMVGVLLSLKNMVPDKAKEAARGIVRAVVDELIKRMRSKLEQAVRGALDRSRHQPIPSLPNLDWKRTIRRNLKNYQPERRLLIPERFYFWTRQQRRKEWNVIIAMDQSGSMAESVVYASVMAAIFATLPALETHVIAFDTEVVDLTPQLSDPVELLFGVQLGGGTDIQRAVAYSQSLMHTPPRTLFVLISDLIEGGDQSRLVRRMADMVAAGVRCVALLALNDSGRPDYDEHLAKEFANVGCPAFACTPNALPEVIEAMLKGQNLQTVADKFQPKK